MDVPRDDVKPAEYDGDLFDIIYALQHGDSEAGWKFTEHYKIQAIIRSRIRDYRRQFHWLPEEDLEDIQAGLRPKLLKLAGDFVLPELHNEGRVVAYFRLRIKGEADYLLKRVTQMRQVSDEDGNLYLKVFSQTIEGLDDIVTSDEVVDKHVVDGIEDLRQGKILKRMIDTIPESSNDRIWLRCYMLRLQGKKWADIAKIIGYTQTDFAWLKDNTARFVSRLKDQLIKMGEDINCRICGIYTDASDVAICVIDTVDPANFLIWSKAYETYQDLDKVEGKLGDIFRQYDITYVIMNDVRFENRAMVICMRYLTKREAFVETTDLLPFFPKLSDVRETIRGMQITPTQRRAYLLAEVKKAHLDCIKERARDSE